MLALGETRRRLDRDNEFPGTAILLSVAEKEILQRQRRCAQPSAHHPGAQRDQRRREIANRRSVGDVAADGAADLHPRRAEATHHFAEVGMDRREQRLSLGKRHARAERQRAVIGLADRIEFDDPTE